MRANVKKQDKAAKPEFYQIWYCLYRLNNSRNNTNNMRQIKEMILAFLGSKNELSKELATANTLAGMVNGVNDRYEKQWLFHLLDSAVLEKELHAINYQPADNENLTALKAA